MQSIRVRNLRSLADTGDIVLKPITLLVGANSSGKSSFLRVFPMLRQSCETRTGSGILLNEPYVDYGVFPIAVRKGADPAEIVLDFEVELNPQTDVRLRRFAFVLEPLTARLSVHFAQRSQAELYSYIREVDVTLGDGLWSDRVVLEAAEDGHVSSLHINEYSAQGEAGRLRLTAGRGIVPFLSAAPRESSKDGAFVPEGVYSSGAFSEAFLKNTELLFHGRTLNETRLNILGAIKIGSPVGMLAQMGTVTDNGFWNARIGAWSASSVPFLQLRNLIIGDKLPWLFSVLSSLVSEFSRAVHYFEPIRARVQRDYMSRDVQVESVESDGKNVAIFLSSLPPVARRSFQEWMIKNFRLSIYPKAVGDGSRIALRLVEEATGSEFNLADMGFGYSQMLPVLVQVWALVERENLRRHHGRALYSMGWRQEPPPCGYLVAVEQPELHLHPAMQARLADLFVNTAAMAKESGVRIRFVIETHSQSIVNRLGHLVERKQLDPRDVQVLLFSRGGKAQEDPLNSEIQLAEFDSEGVLTNWPFGFFLPDIENLEESTQTVVATDD